jgi:hypothetical protein
VDLRPVDHPAGLTLQGKSADESATVDPMLPLALTAPIALALQIGGLVLVIPELSFRHVLGFQYDARRARGYLGLGLMSLSPAVGLVLSGARATTAIAGGLIEAGAIGVSFGAAFLADLAFRGGVFSVTSGVFPVIVAVVAAVVAVAFPVGVAFTNGAQVDADEDRQRTPSFGFVPLDRGGQLVIAGRF